MNFTDIESNVETHDVLVDWCHAALTLKLLSIRFDKLLRLIPLVNHGFGGSNEHKLDIEMGYIEPLNPIKEALHRLVQNDVFLSNSDLKKVACINTIPEKRVVRSLRL